MTTKPDSPCPSPRFILASFMLDVLRDRPTKRGTRPKAVRAQGYAALRFALLAGLIAGGIAWLILT